MLESTYLLQIVFCCLLERVNISLTYNLNCFLQFSYLYFFCDVTMERMHALLSANEKLLLINWQSKGEGLLTLALVFILFDIGQLLK